MKLKSLITLLAGLMLGASAYAAAPAADIKKAGASCERCCCCKHGDTAGNEAKKSDGDGIRKLGKTCEKCGSGGGCCGHAKPDAAAIEAYKKQQQELRTAAAAIKAAKTDAERVQRMQRYIELLDAQMAAMTQQADAHTGHTHDDPVKK